MTPVCGRCRSFVGEAAALERAVPGLKILSSAYGSVRADTGVCERHGSFVTPSQSCPEFQPMRAAGGERAGT
ncbi:MAG: hypothetical protein WCA09_05645 [Burkholderiales bacterium]